ncbi:MAG: hypothetical protein CMH53_07505 [Myxococcales bacterium]|nr:hypothetical protein [Myxococcales bacterium]
MSDARPITDVSEFVCGKCWSSFGRMDETTSREVTCPHCGHRQSSSQRITDALQAISESVASPEQEFAIGEVHAPGAAHRETAAYHSTPLAQRSSVDKSFMDPDTAKSVRPAIAGDDLRIDAFEELTSPEGSKLAELLAQKVQEAAAKAAQSSTPEPVADSAQPEPVAEQPQMNDLSGQERQLPSEIKLKAPPGLTYNFHTLDAMVGWVGNKDPNVMEISFTGEEWRSFGVFLSAIQAGMTAWQAWDAALDSEAPSALDEILRIDAAHSHQSVLDESQDKPAASGRRAAKTTVIERGVKEPRVISRPAIPPPPSNHRVLIQSRGSKKTTVAWIVGGLIAVGAGIAGALWYLGKI